MSKRQEFIFTQLLNVKWIFLYTTGEIINYHKPFWWKFSNIKKNLINAHTLDPWISNIKRYPKEIVSWDVWFSFTTAIVFSSIPAGCVRLPYHFQIHILLTAETCPLKYLWITVLVALHVTLLLVFSPTKVSEAKIMETWQSDTLKLWPLM